MMNTAFNFDNLDAIFDQVLPDYRHIQKWVQPAPALVTSQAYLKWYVLYPQALPITDEQVAQAQNFLLDEMKADRLKLRHEVGFVVLHRCSEMLIIYACTWRGNNEVWETLYHQDLTAGTPFKLFKREDTSPTFCVWVLPAVWHEQQAWVRYLQSSRDPGAKAAYVADQLLAGWV